MVFSELMVQGRRKTSAMITLVGLVTQALAMIQHQGEVRVAMAVRGWFDRTAVGKVQQLKKARRAEPIAVAFCDIFWKHFFFSIT